MPSSRTERRSPATPARAVAIKRGYKARLRRGDLLETIVYFSVAIVLALFLADGGATYFLNIKDVTTGLGIVTGLVGSDLLLVMLVLAARIPVIDRTFGHDKALALHRKLGKPVLYLILAHMLLLMIGYGIAQGLNPLAEAIDMIVNQQDMSIAFISMGLLILVVVTSLVIVRKKLSYEFWYVVHLLSYAAVLLALPHQFTQGSMFAEGTWARGYWMALYAGALAAITIYRVIIPVASSLRHDLRVSEVVVEAPGVVSITMRGRNLEVLRAQGGQFFNWRFWNARMWWDAHPYSLSAHPDGRSLRITVRDLGAGSSRLLQLTPGTRVSFEGPYGLFTDEARTTTKAVFVGAGIGITPIRALLEGSDLAPHEATVILRGSDDTDVYLWQETYDLCVEKAASLRVLVGHRPRGINTWLSAEAYGKGETLLSLAPQIKESDLYICGPTPWTELVIRDAQRLGLKEHQIHAERFDF
ncbi:putative ferric reductase [Aurantimicrobium minutum]|uniref:ferredoxin reductase family protein n=1 Tax=Aurantimicrobium minutum TaxID=708131 RepID=UPI0024733BEF|nr:ferredoxin reductase family protein [Aurantimicrobium minutum]MDH6532395.1 putative ferric reductase [Aurantimicrobium minutum]